MYYTELLEQTLGELDLSDYRVEWQIDPDQPLEPLFADEPTPIFSFTPKNGAASVSPNKLAPLTLSTSNRSKNRLIQNTRSKNLSSARAISLPTPRQRLPAENAGHDIQPSLYLRRRRPRQNAPDARHRPRRSRPAARICVSHILHRSVL